MREYLVNINDKSYKVAVKNFGVDVAELEINGQLYSVKLDEPIQSLSDNKPVSPVVPSRPSAQRTPASSPAPSAAPPSASVQPPQAAGGGGDSEVVKAPIPGSILGIMCKEGDKVKAGQSVIKMEAMKMENDIKVNVGGVVKEIKVNIGDAVGQGDDMIVLKKDV